MQMQTVWAVKHMFPAANDDNFRITVFPDTGTWAITQWDLPDQQPTADEIAAHWNANQAAIIAANKPKPTDFDNLKKQHTDLIFTLMNKGVI